MSVFSEKLKLIRKHQKILQKDLALLMNLPLRTYQSYEYGEAEPNIDGLIKLSDYLNCSIDYLVGRTDNPKINK